MNAIARGAVVASTRVPWLTDGSAFIEETEIVRDAGDAELVAKERWLVMVWGGYCWYCVRRRKRITTRLVKELVQKYQGEQVVVVDASSAFFAQRRAAQWQRSPGPEAHRRKMRKLERQDRRLGA